MYLIVLLLIVFACMKDDNEMETPEPTIQNNYTVSTLTEPFPGSGGLTVDKDGFIYVANYGEAIANANGSEIRKIDPQTGAIEIFATGFSGASGCTFDKAGNLYQSNIQGNFLSKVTSQGEVSTLASSKLSSPVGVAVSSTNQIFVCNCGNNNIIRVSQTGNTEVFATSNLFNCPNGITVDDENNLYVVNFNNSKVIKITPSKEVSLLTETSTGTSGHITFVNGKLYIAGRGKAADGGSELRW